MCCHLQKQPHEMNKIHINRVAVDRGQVADVWWERCPQVSVMFISENLLLRQFHLTAGWDHVLVSDKVSNITSLSYMSHSRVKEVRRGVSSIILSWSDSGVSKDVTLASSILGVARSPGSDVLSIFINAGVFKLPRSLSLMSVPTETRDRKKNSTKTHNHPDVFDG